MDIYFNDEFNEVSLIFKGFSKGNFLNEKSKYSLGELLINFIEFNHDEIIKDIENNFNIIEKNYCTFETNLKNLIKKLIKIHPYFIDSYNGLLTILDIYEETISDYHILKRIQNEEYCFDDLLELKNLLSEDCYSLIQGIETSDNFNLKVNEIIIDTEKKFNTNNSNIKYKLIDCCKAGKKYKEAVEYCLDSENPIEYKNLSTIERYFLYERTHKNYMKISITPSYITGTIKEIDLQKNIFPIIDKANYIELIKLLPSEQLMTFEIIESGAEGLCYFEFMKLINKGIFVQKCKNCNKYFIKKSRADTLYCDREVDETGKTCKDVGAMNTYKKNTKNNPIIKIYQKHYKKNYARTKYKSESKKMSNHDFEKWSNDAMIMRDKAKIGQITYDEFKNWLENS